MTQYFCNKKYIETTCKDPFLLPIIETNLNTEVPIRIIVVNTFSDLYKEILQFSKFDIIATHNYKTDIEYFIEKYFCKDSSTIIKEENYEYYKKILDDIENILHSYINNIFYAWNTKNINDGCWVQYKFESNDEITLIYFLCISTEVIKKDYNYPIFENINNSYYKLNEAINKHLENDVFTALEELNRPGFREENGLI